MTKDERLKLALNFGDKIIEKMINMLPASVIAKSMDEQYQSALAELNLESEE